VKTGGRSVAITGREAGGPPESLDTDLTLPVGEFRGDLQAALADLPIDTRMQQRIARPDMLALAACGQALAQAGLTASELQRGRTGLYLGQSVCGTLVSEAHYLEARRQADSDWPEKLPRGDLLLHEGAHTLDVSARVFGLPGRCQSVMTACSSGANAIGLAAEEIRAGRCDAMLAGGADSLSLITYLGFNSLKVVSPDGPRPFDRERQGMMVGEGAGVLMLESLELAKARGATVLGLLSGWGHSCDAHHLTAPHPEGKGAEAAIRQALNQAALQPAQIGYVNAHGTATPDNDRTEGLAIERVFGPAGVPVSSTKRYMGHTLAAAGGIEAVVSIQALSTGRLPANLGLREALEDAQLDLLRAAREVPSVQHVLSNSFGFGGNNAALVFSRSQ
jgi:3-oxoacyl-(acyl-carrier-protein) synthase